MSKTTTTTIGYLASECYKGELATQNLNLTNKTVATSKFDNIESLEAALKNKEIDYLILPFENSIQGSDLNTLDFLIRKPYLHVVNEVSIPISPFILAAEGTELKDITQVVGCKTYIAHYQTDVEKKLKEFGNEVTFTSSNNLISLYQKVAKGELQNTAIVGDQALSKIFGLNELSGPLGDHPEHNYSRYVLVADHPVTPERHQLPKTLFAITLKNAPGTLMKVFSVFSLRDINIFKVESRASVRSVREGSAWEYVMVVEVDGAPKVNLNLDSVFNNLKEFSSDVRYLGSYPRHFPKVTQSLAPIGL